MSYGSMGSVEDWSRTISNHGSRLEMTLNNQAVSPTADLT